MLLAPGKVIWGIFAKIGAFIYLGADVAYCFTSCDPNLNFEDEAVPYTYKKGRGPLRWRGEDPPKPKKCC